MTHPYAILSGPTLVGLFDDLTSALAAIELGGGNVYERISQGARNAEKLAEIVAMARRCNHPGVEPGTHAFANRILAVAEKEGERGFE